MNQIIAAGIAIAVMAGAYQFVKDKGVQQERARVVAREVQTYDKISKAQRAAAKPATGGVLDKWQRE